MPSSRNSRVIRALDSGSSTVISRSATSRTVTSAPKRRSAWASSQPIGPPPITAIEAGTSAILNTSRLVQYGVSARPSIGGATGAVPVLRTTPRAAAYTPASGPSTTTRPGPSSRAWPRTTVTPASTRPRTWLSSDQSLVASSRIRCATRPQSGVIVVGPASASAWRASPTRSEARIQSLLGMQP